MTTTPPHGLPRYRIITGVDDLDFCNRVAEAVDLGYHLYGGPSVTFNGDAVIVAQALIWAGTPVTWWGGPGRAP